MSRHALKAARHLRFDIDFLMVVAAIGAAILGHWAEGALLLFLFSLGRARHAIQALGEIRPKTARVCREGRESELPVEELLRGDVVVVRPGERLPIDGQVLEGRSAVDQSPITGESVPLEKRPGDEVLAGSVNGESTLEVVWGQDDPWHPLNMARELVGAAAAALVALDRGRHWPCHGRSVPLGSSRPGQELVYICGDQRATRADN